MSVYQNEETVSVRQLAPDFYHSFLSKAAKERKPSASTCSSYALETESTLRSVFPVRGLYPLESKPGVISFLAGKPNDAMFPFKSLSFTATCPSNPGEVSTVSLSGPELAIGLQYGATAGLPRLIDWFVGLQERSHGRIRNEGWRLSVGTGSQDLIWKVSRAELFLSVVILTVVGHSSSR